MHRDISIIMCLYGFVSFMWVCPFDMFLDICVCLSIYLYLYVFLNMIVVAGNDLSDIHMSRVRDDAPISHLLLLLNTRASEREN